MFEVFSAGYEAGYAGNKDLKAAYDEYYESNLKEITEKI